MFLSVITKINEKDGSCSVLFNILTIFEPFVVKWGINLTDRM